MQIPRRSAPRNDSGGKIRNGMNLLSPRGTGGTGEKQVPRRFASRNDSGGRIRNDVSLLSGSATGGAGEMQIPRRFAPRNDSEGRIRNDVSLLTAGDTGGQAKCRFLVAWLLGMTAGGEFGMTSQRSEPEATDREFKNDLAE